MTAHKHEAPSIADQIAGKIKRGLAEVVGSHDLQAEGKAQEHEGNPDRAEALARAAVDGEPAPRPAKPSVP